MIASENAVGQCLYTVLIPTHNRQLKLVRLLNYLNRFQCKVVIADSSENPVDTKSFGNVVHIKDTNLDFKDKVVEGCKRVETAFVVLAADDDFPILDKLNSILIDTCEFSLMIGRVGMFNEDLLDERFWYKINRTIWIFQCK